MNRQESREEAMNLQLKTQRKFVAGSRTNKQNGEHARRK
jgi:hypothetical protein